MSAIGTVRMDEMVGPYVTYELKGQPGPVTFYMAHTGPMVEEYAADSSHDLSEGLRAELPGLLNEIEPFFAKLSDEQRKHLVDLVDTWVIETPEDTKARQVRNYKARSLVWPSGEPEGDTAVETSARYIEVPLPPEPEDTRHLSIRDTHDIGEVIKDWGLNDLQRIASAIRETQKTHPTDATCECIAVAALMEIENIRRDRRRAEQERETR